MLVRVLVELLKRLLTLGLEEGDLMALALHGLEECSVLGEELRSSWRSAATKTSLKCSGTSHAWAKVILLLDLGDNLNRRGVMAAVEAATAGKLSFAWLPKKRGTVAL